MVACACLSLSPLTSTLYRFLAAQVVNLIRTKLQEHRSLETAVRDVTAEAISAGSVDNVSVVVLAFHQKLKQEAGRQP